MSKHSVVNASIDNDGIRTIDLTVGNQATVDNVQTTMSISPNPYYYGDMIRFKTDGPITVSIPLARFMRQLIDLYGYDAVKDKVDNYPQELRFKR